MYYYVDAIEGKRFWLLLGPFLTHDEALQMVDSVRAKACEISSWFDFASFGTCSTATNTKQGKLNHAFRLHG